MRCRISDCGYEIMSNSPYDLIEGKDDRRERLVRELLARMAFDDKWSWWHLRFATFWNVVAISGSAGTTILAAIGSFPSWVVAVCAATSTVAILVLQRFGYYRRSRWHTLMSSHERALIRALVYENADPAEISRRFSKLQTQRELDYPGQGLDGLGFETRELRKSAKRRVDDSMSLPPSSP